MDEHERRYEIATAGAGPLREEPRPLGVALVAGLAAAIVGGVAWGLVVRFSDYEVGIVAWAIGALVGFAVLAAARARGPALQVVAVACALVGILLGKYLSYAFIVQEQAEEAGFDVGLLSSDMWSFFREDLEHVFGWFDLLWVGLAVFTAWRTLQPREPELPPTAGRAAE